MICDSHSGPPRLQPLTHHHQRIRPLIVIHPVAHVREVHVRLSTYMMYLSGQYPSDIRGASRYHGGDITPHRPTKVYPHMATIAEAIESLSTDQSIRHIVSLSGGKDSTALAIYMRRKYPQLPVEYIFCDTGCELPETYEYLERLEALLGVRVQHLNALDLLGAAHKHNRTPFDVWLNEVYGGFLPSPRSRWCTRVLKIEPFEKYVGDDYAYSYIGIRGDEDRDGYVAKRPPKLSERPNIVPVYPFKDDHIGLVEVKSILEESGLGLPDYYRWRSRSGCYFCFYQQIGEWQRLQEEHPDLFELAKRYENPSADEKHGKQYRWCEGKTLDDIAAMPIQPLPIVDESEGCAICHL